MYFDVVKVSFNVVIQHVAMQLR